MIRPLLAVVAEREAAAGVVDEEVAAVDAQAPCRAQAVHRPTMIGRIRKSCYTHCTHCININRQKEFRQMSL